MEIYELFGPVMTREALKAAGDIKAKTEDVLNRRQEMLEEAKNREHTHYGQHSDKK